MALAVLHFSAYPNSISSFVRRGLRPCGAHRLPPHKSHFTSQVILVATIRVCSVGNLLTRDGCRKRVASSTLSLSLLFGGIYIRGIAITFIFAECILAAHMENPLPPTPPFSALNSHAIHIFMNLIYICTHWHVTKYKPREEGYTPMSCGSKESSRIHG